MLEQLMALVAMLA
jgi:hypothetical protein